MYHCSNYRPRNGSWGLYASTQRLEHKSEQHKYSIKQIQNDSPKLKLNMINIEADEFQLYLKNCFLFFKKNIFFSCVLLLKPRGVYVCKLFSHFLLLILFFKIFERTFLMSLDFAKRSSYKNFLTEFLPDPQKKFSKDLLNDLSVESMQMIEARIKQKFFPGYNSLNKT